MPWTVSDAFVIPALAASAKLVGDDAVISITFATLIGSSLSGAPIVYPVRRRRQPSSVVA
jgi:hypothetical protein